MIHYDSLLQNAAAILLQNAAEVCYKMRLVFCYKMRQLLKNATILLQNPTVIKKCDNFITKCDSYYKILSLLQIVAIQLSNIFFTQLGWCQSASQIKTSF